MVASEDGSAFLGATITFAPKVGNSVVRRRFASIWRLSRAAVTAAPAPRARRTTMSRPRLAEMSRRTMRQNMRRDWDITRLAGSARVHTARHVAEGLRFRRA